MADKEYLRRLTVQLNEQGKLIEAGWVGLRIAAIPDHASAVQLEEMRNAFFAGAHHLMNSIVATLDPDAEPTENDIRRLSLIHHELDVFLAEFKKKHGLP